MNTKLKETLFLKAEKEHLLDYILDIIRKKELEIQDDKFTDEVTLIIVDNDISIKVFDKQENLILNIEDNFINGYSQAEYLYNQNELNNLTNTLNFIMNEKAIIKPY